MLEVIGVLLFLWLMGKVSGLLFRLAWGAVKVIAILLLAAALPMLAAGLLCAGGMMLLVLRSATVDSGAAERGRLSSQDSCNCSKWIKKTTCQS